MFQARFREMVTSLIDVDLKKVMQVHALVCIVLGLIVIIVPHRFFMFRRPIIPEFVEYRRRVDPEAPIYNHSSHELSRLYGCLTLGIGWFVWSTKDIRDARLMRAISETFCICYTLQSFIMLRAQFTSDDTNNGILDIFHWLVAIIFLLIGILYGYLRASKKLKSYDFPGMQDE